MTEEENVKIEQVFIDQLEEAKAWYTTFEGEATESLEIDANVYRLLEEMAKELNTTPDMIAVCALHRIVEKGERLIKP